MRRGTPSQLADCHRMRADTQQLAALQVRPRLGHRPLVKNITQGLDLAYPSYHRPRHGPNYSRKVSAAFEGFAFNQARPFFAPAADRSGPVRLQPLEPRARGLHRSSGAGRTWLSEASTCSTTSGTAIRPAVIVDHVMKAANGGAGWLRRRSLLQGHNSV